MSSQQLQFYEQKIISDKEFPISISTHTGMSTLSCITLYMGRRIFCSIRPGIPFDKAI